MKYVVWSQERLTATKKKAMTNGFRRKLDFVAGNLQLAQYLTKVDLNKTIVLHNGSSKDVMRTYDEVPGVYDCQAVIGITALSTNLQTKHNHYYLLSSHYETGNGWDAINNRSFVEESQYLAKDTDFCNPIMIGGKSISRDLNDEDLINLAAEYKQKNEFTEITVKDDICLDALENPGCIFTDSNCKNCHQDEVLDNRNLYYTAFEMDYVPASHATLLAKRVSPHAVLLLNAKTQQSMAYITPDMMRVSGFDVPKLNGTAMISLNRADRLRRQFQAVRETVDYWIYDPDWNNAFDSFGW